jgi:hypothetical protein
MLAKALGQRSPFGTRSRLHLSRAGHVVLSRDNPAAALSLQGLRMPAQLVVYGGADASVSVWAAHIIGYRSGCFKKCEIHFVLASLCRERKNIIDIYCVKRKIRNVKLRNFLFTHRFAIREDQNQAFRACH